MKTVFIITFIFLGSISAANATSKSTHTLSLQNLERERAALIDDLLNPTLNMQERMQKLNKRQRHLTDIERMVMRDERLISQPSKWVKQAFDNYDSTFLVHAGAEQKLKAGQQWLSHIQLTNEAVSNTRMTYRKR